MTKSVKIGIVLSLLLAGLSIALVKSGMLQIARGADLNKLANRQYQRSAVYRGLRGDIYDRRGELLATSIWLDSIYAEPRKIENPKVIAAALKSLMPELSKEVLAQLDTRKGFVWIARRIDPAVSEKLRALKLPGIGFKQEEKRFYPGHSLMGQLIGSVSIDGAGLSGIEKSFEPYLKAREWTTLAYTDARGIALKPFIAPSPENLRGDDVYLTLDKNLQSVTEAALAQAIAENGAKSGLAIVIEVESGDILALANYPFFNPNAAQRSAVESRRNQAISFTGEPGSTFKMITMAAAYEHINLTKEEQIFCENGIYHTGNLTIRDIKKKEWLSVEEIFKFSSNIGTFKIAERVGKDNLYETIQRFGFGQPVGLGLEEEAKGSVSPPKSWGLARFANVSFGYGLMASPIQLLMAASSVANHGIRVPPRLVQTIVRPNNTKWTYKNTNEPRRVMSAKAAHRLTDLMVQVTEGEGGSGNRARIDGVLVASKTGTAEKVDPLTKRYNKKKNRSSFLGFAPADNPKIAAIVVVDEPTGFSYGGIVAAPAWKTMVTTALLQKGLVGELF